MRQWTHCIKESERRNKLKRFCELWCWESFQNSSRFAPTFLFYETEMMWWSGNSRFINLSTKEKQLYLLNICDKQYLHFGAQFAWVVFIQKPVIGEQRQTFYTLNPGWNVKCAVAGQLFQSKTNTKTKKKNPVTSVSLFTLDIFWVSQPLRREVSQLARRSDGCQGSV